MNDLVFRDNKEILNAPSALLSYISTREFLRIREKCGEARAEGSRNKFFIIFFYKIKGPGRDKNSSDNKNEREF